MGEKRAKSLSKERKKKAEAVSLKAALKNKRRQSEKTKKSLKKVAKLLKRKKKTAKKRWLESRKATLRALAQKEVLIKKTKMKNLRAVKSAGTKVHKAQRTAERGVKATQKADR